MSLFVTDYEMLIVIQLILLFTMLSQIGIDIEENKRKTAKNVLSLADRFFTPSEFDYLVNIPDPDAQEKEFIKLWTLKVSKNFSDPI
jgi:phosphopantetheinyl transferase